jgi:hypothetical protein
MFLYSDSVFIDAFEFEKKLCNIGSKMSFNILVLFFKKSSLRFLSGPPVIQFVLVTVIIQT